MIQLNIDDAEKDDLKEFLQHCLNWLSVEIHHTDARSFREKVKGKRAVIQNLMDQLGSHGRD